MPGSTFAVTHHALGMGNKEGQQTETEATGAPQNTIIHYISKLVASPRSVIAPRYIQLHLMPYIQHPPDPRKSLRNLVNNSVRYGRNIHSRRHREQDLF